MFGTPSIRSGIVVEYMPIVKMLKMDLVNGDDTDFFHSAGHKATFLEKERPFQLFSSPSFFRR